MQNKNPKNWRIEWRGKITHDIGESYEVADTHIDAIDQFTARYPMREITYVVELVK